MAGFKKSYLVAEFSSGSDQRAEIAALQLSTAGSQSLELVTELLGNPDPDVRWWATRSLADIHNSESIPLLLKALADSDAAVQQCAAVALRSNPDPRAVPPLVNSLDTKDRLLSRLAGDALIAIGSKSVPALIAVMGNGSQPAQLEAVRALAVIGDTRAIPALMKVFDQDSAVMEHWAELGLEKMGVGTIFFEP